MRRVAVASDNAQPKTGNFFSFSGKGKKEVGVLGRRITEWRGDRSWLGRLHDYVQRAGPCAGLVCRLDAPILCI